MTREMNKKCLFGAKHFLTISGDNRLRLWDIASNKELRCFVEKHHLSRSYTCFAWGQDESKKGGSDLGVCAVGTSDGQVIVWDLTRGVVARTVEAAGGSASPAIVDIQFSRDTQSIYVCSADNSIFEYCVKSGETKQVLKGFKKGASCLAVHQKTVAAASGSVKLLGEGGKKLKLSASFPAGGVAVMSFSKCGKFLACAGAGSREFVVFSVEDWEASGHSGTVPLCVCSVNGVPQRLEFAFVQSAGGKKSPVAVDVLCVLQQPAGGCVVRVDVSEGSTVVAPFGVGSADPPVLSGCFSSPTGSITLATGQVSSPRFITVPYLDAVTDSLVNTITLPISGNGMTSGIIDDKHEIDVRAAVSVLGPHENGGTKRPLVADGTAGPDDKRMKSRAGSNGGLDKLTVEERLNGAAAALLKMETLGAEAVGESGNVTSTATTDSLVTLVEQAMQAGDDGLLEQCLDCSDADVVAETSKRLPTRLVVPLLRRLVAKFEKKPARGVLLTRWIHNLLRSHMSYLLSVPDLAQQLAALSQMLEQRLATYMRLSSLAGRLDLLLSQISSPSPSSSRVQADKGPTQTYYED